VVINGAKKFELFPPTDWTNIYLNSFLHPNATKGQVDIKNPDFNIFPNFQNATKHTVIVRKGETLYIPPLWFHQVTSMERMTISISIWSDCYETSLIDKCISLGLPFKPTLSREEKN